MEDTVYLEWAFEPEDYFENEISSESDFYNLSIQSGKIIATMSPEYYYAREDTRDRLHNEVESRLLGVQVLTHKPYTLSKASMHRIRPNGQKDVTIFPESIVMTCTVGSVDLIVKDKDGNIVSNSKADRINKKKSFSELTVKYSKDPLVQSLLNSYNAAVSDPENELVHLYELREAISSSLGGESKTRNLLGITKGDWSNFGRLANLEPLTQGRHRGKNYGSLRDATQAELEICRAFSRNLVEKYFEYRESNDR